ncbi:MAG TPA: sugar phosphate nucleotidyltransferase [Gemmatimonadaceae bacterium]|nr:sugar phosphate nucleotidyltransferase [Gemmatimonadaceae bacterium]
MSPAPGDVAGKIWPVILAGGIGSRFWPMSTPQRPKQFLPLLSPQPMLRDTLDRLLPLAPGARTLVLTSASLADSVRSIVPEVPPDNIIAEPRAAGTAAALAWAAHEIARRAGPDALMVSLHADWAIEDAPRFRATLLEAAAGASREHALVTVGIVPRHPDTGLGYIQPGDVVNGSLRRVERFVEKPDLERARALLATGSLWNSGIFAWRVDTLLEEVRAHCPEVAPALDAHGEDRVAFFAAVQPIAIDVGVLERSQRVLVLPGDFGWSDVGTWAALRDVGPADANGNVATGPSHLHETHDSVVHADGPTVVLYGVSDVVVVATRGLTLVTTVERAANLKTLLDSLPDEVRRL